MQKRYPNILLCGGGLDSIAYLILLKRGGLDFAAMVVNYGQKAFPYERKATEYFCNKYGIELIEAANYQIVTYNNLDTCQLFTGDIEQSAYVNGRNLALIMQALEYSDNVYLGLTDPGYKPFPDADEGFIFAINSMMERVFNKPINIRAPFIRTQRIQVFKEAYEVDKEFFTHSSTCWVGNNCGVCKHCILKKDQEQKVKEMLNEKSVD